MHDDRIKKTILLTYRIGIIILYVRFEKRFGNVIHSK